MILIEEILVSDSIVKQYFHCNLNACKGACCHEGDYGAPLELDEQKALESPPEGLMNMLDEEARNKIISESGIAEYKEDKSIGTNLLENGACVFMSRSALGISYCAIEKAYKEKAANEQ